MNLLILLATLNGISAFKNADQHSVSKGDNLIMMLHGDAIFGEFMLSGAMSRDKMNAMLKENGIPMKVSAQFYGKLMENWVYNILG